MAALAEISSSDSNMRSAMQPPTHGHKRQGSQLPEPAPKRKTLVERAGEPIKPASSAPKSNNAACTGIVPPGNFSQYRSTSNLSTSTSRTSAQVSRQTSTSSFASSVNSGLRPPSIQSFSGLARPKTALARDKVASLPEAKAKATQEQEKIVQELIKKRTSPFLFPSLSTKARRKWSGNSVKPSGARYQCVPQVKKHGIVALPMSRRDLSLVSKLQTLSLETLDAQTPRKNSQSPSKLPRLAGSIPCPAFGSSSSSTPPPPPSPHKHRRTSPRKQYLTRFANTEALDADEHYTNFKRMFEDYQVLYKQTLGEAHEARSANNVYTSTIEKLELERNNTTETIIILTSENEKLKYRLEAAERALEAQRQEHELYMEEFKQRRRKDIDDLRQEQKKEVDDMKNEHRDECKELKRKQEVAIEEERKLRVQLISETSTQEALEKQRQQMELEMKNQEIKMVKAEVQHTLEMLEREKSVSGDLRRDVAEAGSNATSAESTRLALQAKIEFLESDSKSQSEAYAEMERKMNEAFAEAAHSMSKLRKEETLRRKLHNQVQELKGNIRVFCRVRPSLASDDAEELATMSFPDGEEATEIEVKGPEEKNSLGKVTTKTHPFTFDRVFDPSSHNNEIFEEISQLIQSALDGFNVCIFAYGQTGSGKTHTMSAEDGVIPRALRQIYATSQELEDRGWQYTMAGSFVEVYNEDIRDLLGDGSDNKRHEVRHDMAKCETTITDVNSITLDSQEQVERMLEQAMSKRSVAATKANERSSRSHSVFILKLSGTNSITGETSKGTLNLVDLAGSERLSHSKVEGQRLKETQSINKSLSCLGDVIGALGQAHATPTAFDPRASTSTSASVGPGNHIPYRNSKLTYLLQFSLGGNSKTLMFVMVAPEKRCLGETLTSLKFADKVSRTRVGVAKKVK